MPCPRCTRSSALRPGASTPMRRQIFLPFCPMRKRARPVCWPRRSCSCSIPPCTSCRMVRPPRCCSPRNAPGRYTPSSCCRPSSGKTRSLPLPDAPAALSLTLTTRDVEEIDACPAALGHRLACGKAGKRWLHHPRAETYLSERVALFQRLYR